MDWLAESGRGFKTRHGRVPIVVGAVIYDLGVGSAEARPRAEQGYLACVAASGVGHQVGSVGAGVGATMSKWRGPEMARPSGIGAATVISGALTVSALMVVNPIGDVLAGESEIDLGPVLERFERMANGGGTSEEGGRENTVIGVVATNAILDKVGCHLVAQSGHDGIAQSIWPAHLSGDGDAVVAASVPSVASVTVPVDAVRALAQQAVAQAIRSVGELSAVASV